MNKKLFCQIFWLIIVLILIPMAVRSQQIELLHDINKIGTQDSKPEYISTTNNLIFFAANDGIHGLELWRSDGTASGTQLVKDIIPGFSSFEITGGTALDELAIYAVNTEEYGVELWRSDGTEAGTFLIKDINPGSGDGMNFWPWFDRGEMKSTSLDTKECMVRNYGKPTVQRLGR
jgi:ELWxxDGT repeat protein